MDRTTQTRHLRADSAALLGAWRDDPTAAVPSCPGWDRGDLLGHVARVHAWHRAQVEAGPATRLRFSEAPKPSPDDDLGAWFEAGVTALAGALPEVDLDATFQTWAGPQPGSFYPRRMAQETAVHRWDGVGGDIDAALAADGVDELLEVFAPVVPAERLERSGTLHLHATDIEGEWLVALGPTGITFERGHAKGDAALRGRAADLLLWAWNRVPADDRFEVFGDTALLELWPRAVVF